MAEKLGDILKSHILGLRRYAMALSGNSVEADDLVQECLARALSRAHVWAKVRDHRAYLFTILHNIYVDGVIRQRRQGIQVPIEDATPILRALPNQQERLEIRDLKRGLAALPDTHRSVVLLVGLEGMSYRQTADILGVPIGTIMSRLSRGREMLRRHMNNDQNERTERALQDGAMTAVNERA